MRGLYNIPMFRLQQFAIVCHSCPADAEVTIQIGLEGSLRIMCTNCGRVELIPPLFHITDPVLAHLRNQVVTRMEQLKREEYEAEIAALEKARQFPADDGSIGKNHLINRLIELKDFMRLEEAKSLLSKTEYQYVKENITRSLKQN